jgi:hypothetical protein
MTSSIAPLLEQVLEHVDVEVWRRPEQLVRLVAGLQCGPCPVPIGPALLNKELGRSPREAVYDHRVLVRLATRDRVLLRWQGAGRSPDAWAINPDLARWRHVPWITPRRAVLSSFLPAWEEKAVPLMMKSAGQPCLRWHIDAENGGSEAFPPATLSGKDVSSTARGVSSTARRPGETPPGCVINGTAAPRDDNYIDLSKERSLSLSFEADRQRERRRAQRQAWGWVVALVAETAGTQLFGAPEGRVLDAAEACGDREAIEAAAAATKGLGNGYQAAERFAAVLGRAQRACKRCGDAGWWEDRHGRRHHCDHGPEAQRPEGRCGCCGGVGWTLDPDGREVPCDHWGEL